MGVQKHPGHRKVLKENHMIMSHSEKGIFVCSDNFERRMIYQMCTKRAKRGGHTRQAPVAF